MLEFAKGLAPDTFVDLTLDNNNLQDEGIKVIANHFPDNSIGSLSINNCGMTSEGCVELARNLPRLSIAP